MTNGKRAYALEGREKKIIDYTQQIKLLIDRVNLNPLAVDYSEELKRLHRKHPKDKGLILVAEREAYKKEKK
jgi:hypothetical protein